MANQNQETGNTNGTVKPKKKVNLRKIGIIAGGILLGAGAYLAGRKSGEKRSSRSDDRNRSNGPEDYSAS